MIIFDNYLLYIYYYIFILVIFDAGFKVIRSFSIHCATPSRQLAVMSIDCQICFVRQGTKTDSEFFDPSPTYIYGFCFVFYFGLGVRNFLYIFIEQMSPAFIWNAFILNCFYLCDHIHILLNLSSYPSYLLYSQSHLLQL